MSFSTVCPNCDARLTAPDSVEGKRVKCKKCGDPFVARPLDGESDDPPERPSAKASARSRPRPVEDDEDDDRPRRPARATRRDDDDDDRPRRRLRDDEPRPKSTKGKKQKKAGPPVLQFVLLSVAALLVIGGGAVGVYYAFIKEQDKPNPSSSTDNISGTGGGKASASASIAGWHEYQSPNSAFSVKVPGTPVTTGKKTAKSPNGNVVDVDTYMSESADTGVVIMVVPVAGGAQLDENTKNQALDTAVNAIVGQLKGGQLLNSSKLSHGGLPARDVAMRKPDGSEAMGRFILAGDRMFNLLYAAKSGPVNQDRARLFFESFRIR